MANNDGLIAVKMLLAAYPQSKADEATLAVYMATLADLNTDDLRRAVLWCIAHCKFMPTVAEIREAAINSDEANRVPTSGEAWGEVMCQVRSVGNWGIPTFSSPTIERAVDAIGWREICLSEEPGVIRGQFLKIYATFEGRAKDERQAITGNERAWNIIAGAAQKMRMLPGGDK